VVYELIGHALTSDIKIDNPGEGPLPFGFGTHPYFRVPLGGSSGEDCQVTVPVGSSWELEELLPTGRKATTAAVEQLSQGMPVKAMRLDNVFGDLKFDNHRLDSTIHDPHSGRTLTQEFDDQFTACVIYNPPHRQAVCIEPYTGVPDPFTLLDRGIDPHLLTLAPGESFRTRIEIRVD
jgi:aldose 1-epimerase